MWRLFDICGFPIDSTKLIAKEQGLQIKDEEVSAAQVKAREVSRGEKKGMSELTTLDVHNLVTLDIIDNVPTTSSTEKYQRQVIEATVKAIYFSKRFSKAALKFLRLKSLLYSSTRQIVTPSLGGQRYDTGRLVIDDFEEVDVRNVETYNR
jgi:alanyl-tRNA synthetase